jgi:hypothetical protein
MRVWPIAVLLSLYVAAVGCILAVGSKTAIVLGTVCAGAGILLTFVWLTHELQRMQYNRYY